MKTKHKRSFDLLSGYDYYCPGTGGLFGLFGLLLAGACIGNLAVLLLQRFAGAQIAATYGTLIAYPIQFLPAMLYAAAKSNPFGGQDCVKVDEGRFSPIGFARLALMVVPVTWAAAIICEPSGLLLPEMPDFLKRMMESLTDGPLWVSILCTSIFAPFFEEWLCRGMILRGMLRKVHPAWAIIISAIFFAIIHFNPWQGIPAFALGCLFGLVYWKTGSLKLTILMHAVNNLTSVILSRIPKFENCEYLFQAIDNNVIFVMIYLLSVALTVLFCIKMLKTDFTK